MKTPSPQLLRQALYTLDPRPRDQWITMGMALKSALGDAGFDLWDQWSQQAPNYQARAARDSWKSFRPGGGVTVASLLGAARAAGFDWRQHSETAGKAPDLAQLASERHAALLADRELRQRQQAAAADKAQTLWSRSRLVEARHGYLQSHRMIPYGARQMRQLLLLPMYSDNRLVNLQLIGPDGQKRFLTGGQVRGTSLWLGQAEDASAWLLCEGWATACSLHQASKLPVCVAFNAHNLETVARQLAQDGPPVFVCGDRDASGTGQQAARKAGALLGARGYVLLPDFGPDADPALSDFNDLHRQQGLAALQQQLAPKIWLLPLSAGQQEGEAVPSEPERREPEPLSEDTATPPWAAGHAEPPPGYVLYAEGQPPGLYWQPSPQKPGQWLCAPLYILARTRDVSGDHWGRLLTWKDAEGRVRQSAVTSEQICGDAQSLLSILARGGLDIDPSRFCRERLASYVMRTDCQRFARITPHSGWHDQAFVLPDEVIGPHDDLLLLNPLPHGGEARLQGNLSDWQQQVALPAAHNSRPVFALSMALAPPLLRWQPATGGFHLLGGSSIGKTTLLELATSVWGHPQHSRHQWRSTSNGLEGLCSQHHDLLLVLDELSQLSPQQAGEAAYLIANGQGKARADRQGKLLQQMYWRLLLLSAGELTMSDHLRTAGQALRGGQEVRLIDLSADAGVGLGVLEQCAPFPDSGSWVRHIQHAVRQHHGHAGRAFLRQLVAQHEQVAPLLSMITSRFSQQHLNQQAKGQIRRSIQRFALVACAGELAIRWGVLPWPVGHAEQMVGRLLGEWLRSRGGQSDSDLLNGLAQVRAYLETYGESRFTPWREPTDDEPPQRTLQRVGFRRMKDDACWFYVLPTAMRHELCKGYPFDAMLAEMVRLEWLQTNGKNRATLLTRLPGMGTTPVRVYVLTPKVWES
ncbi:DUF927 domain-containing protein [Paludibacterium sp. THUN1379]|uniref:DUF927 domain-containing protein n=1 Tax=Paludibacterium sp. THUN1379 TaxID=3112107 RepID=UPI00308F26B7|nr:DUF927 domain-containing protein [Paludibacterium sp. THUN1379]